jgi:hypothetical protein
MKQSTFLGMFDQIELIMDDRKYIQSQISLFHTLSKTSIPDVLNSIDDQTKELQGQVKKVRVLLERDLTRIAEMRKEVSARIRHAEMAGRYLGKFMNPHQLAFSSKGEDVIFR